jgi:NAD+ synthase
MTRVLEPRALDIDAAAESAHIASRMTEIVGRDLRRRGVVVALSGGVDSSVAVALAVKAFSPGRVRVLLLPERESSAASVDLGRRVAAQFGVEPILHDITAAIEGLGGYRLRDEAMAEVIPGYGPGWKSKLVIAGGQQGGLNYFKLIARAPDGTPHEARVGPRPYLQIVAAQSYKQRMRKTVEYFHADCLNYAVVGTPNRLEYDQGFFVKNGDGSADVKPIAHLYKTQVYALARHFDLPREICEGRPTTDTYTLEQGQDEFYFALPYEKMDIALYALNNGFSPEELGPVIGLDAAKAALVYRDIRSKRSTTRPLHLRPQLIRPVPEVAH